MSDSDSDLLRRFAFSADHNAFTELVQRRIDLVYATALRQVRGDVHRAKDITQEVFIALARKAGPLSRHPSLVAWLHTSARYAAVNLIRVEQRRVRREAEAETMPDENDAMPPDAGQIAAVLDDTMHELNERDRSAVLLRFFGRASFAEIGAQLGLTENAAQKRVDRALDRLREGLGRRGVTSTGAALSAALTAQAAVAAPESFAASVATAALGATGAAGAVSAGTIFLMTKFKFILAGAIVLAGAATFVVQQQRNARLREETARLQPDNGNVLLAPAGGRPSSAAAAAPSPTASAPTATASVASAPASPAPAGLVPIANLRNAGSGSADAAYESVFWAVAHHDVETLGKLISLSERGKTRAQAAFEKVPAPVIDGTHITTPEEMIGFLFTAKMGQFDAMRVGSRNERTPDDVTIGGMLQHPDGRTDTVNLDLHHGSDGWQWQISDKIVLYAADEWERSMQSRAAAAAAKP